ncbi:hypothetical protein LP422_23895 [Janibacter limosus]|uniref:hypothetical protein n=1 Tax=Janibacter limosus TaxID=53458 RepID=UPI0035D6AA0E|nr:hypothetical protein LP422_23895 [Janibacter limosus]
MQSSRPGDGRPQLSLGRRRQLLELTSAGSEGHLRLELVHPTPHGLLQVLVGAAPGVSHIAVRLASPEGCAPHA